MAGVRIRMTKAREEQKPLEGKKAEECSPPINPKWLVLNPPSPK